MYVIKIHFLTRRLMCHTYYTPKGSVSRRVVLSELQMPHEISACGTLHAIEVSTVLMQKNLSRLVTTLNAAVMSYSKDR